MPAVKRSELAAPVLMVRVTAVLWVMVPAYVPVPSAFPSHSKPVTVMFAPMTLLLEPELLSKMATSLLPGTEALFEPPLVVAQLVFAVAAQVFAEPPPTQNLEANLYYSQGLRAR